MTDFWLTTYIVLWLLVISLVLLQIGMLREMGMMRKEGPSNADLITLPEAAGPVIGSELPHISLESINLRGIVTLGAPGVGRSLLLVFLSPTCSGCQHIVVPLNDRADASLERVETYAVMVGELQACSTFLTVFPLNFPVIFDANETLTHAFGVRNSPFSLLYDERGLLVRKGWTEDADDLAALFGDSSVPLEALNHVYPRPQESNYIHSQMLQAE